MRVSNIRKIIPTVFFTMIFVYIWLWIKPCLYLQRGESTFIYDYNYIIQFADFPGGITELADSFLSQFFYHSWLGAAVILLTLILNYMIMKQILVRLNTNAANLVYFPIIFIVIKILDS